MDKYENLVALLEATPNALDRAFQVNENTDEVYFLMGEFLPINSSSPDGLQSYGDCLKLIEEDGKLLQTRLYVKKVDRLNYISYAKFHELLKLGFSKAYDKMPTRFRHTQIIRYNTLGIK